MFKDPKVGAGIAAAALALALYFSLSGGEGTVVREQTLDWYHDLNTGELFTGPFEVPLNIPAPSGDWKEGGGPAGARALVYACGGGCEDAAKRKVAYIERWKPGVATATDMQELIKGKLVRNPNDPKSEWTVSGSPEGTKIRNAGRLDCESQKLPYEVCIPPGGMSLKRAAE